MSVYPNQHQQQVMCSNEENCGPRRTVAQVVSPVFLSTSLLSSSWAIQPYRPRSHDLGDDDGHSYLSLSALIGFIWGERVTTYLQEVDAYGWCHLYSKTILGLYSVTTIMWGLSFEFGHDIRINYHVIILVAKPNPEWVRVYKTYLVESNVMNNTLLIQMDVQPTTKAAVSHLCLQKRIIYLADTYRFGLRSIVTGSLGLMIRCSSGRSAFANV